jgi:hypothetical protein
MLWLLHPAAELIKLGVERLAVGADASIAETAILRMCCGHIFQQTEPVDRARQANLPKVLIYALRAYFIGG